MPTISRELVTASVEYAKALDLLDAQHPQAHAARERIWAQAEAHLGKLIAAHVEAIVTNQKEDV